MNKNLMRTAVRNTLVWFQNSGIMTPADGFWGVAERLVITNGNGAMAEIDRNFPLRTELKPGLVAIENRRADCAAETALLFELAAQYFNDDSYRKIADNLLEFLLHRSNLRYGADSPRRDLWAWAMQGYAPAWTDDNAQVALSLLWLAANGRPELQAPGVATAAALRRHITGYLDYLDDYGREANFDGFSPMMGVRLNPHWLGLTTLAFVWAWSFTGDVRYRELCERIFKIMPGGAPKWDTLCHVDDPELEWSVSEYAYWLWESAVAARAFGDELYLEAGKRAAAALLSRRNSCGSFVSNHHEAPRGAECVDLIYTHNWALYALTHWHDVAGTPEVSAVRDRAFELAVEIQDATAERFFNGCWRGMFDCRTKSWGGGDRHEGGANSIYSGWTNAPIATAMLLELTGKRFFAPAGRQS